MPKAAIILCCFMLASVAARAAAPFDELFVRHEAQGSLYEVAVARMAQSRATRSAVRDYASTLVNDHEAYNGALRELAESKGIAVPSVMQKSDVKRLDRLGRSHGRAFDADFVREARRVNAKDMRSLRQEASRATDPDIRRFVERFIPVEEQHEAGALALTGRDVASRGPVIRPPHTGDTMRVTPPPSDSKMPVISPPAAAPK